MFEEGGRQYVKIMTWVPRQRLVIPLTGQGEIRGDLRVVLDEEKRRVEIHRAVGVRPREAKGKPVAVDFGVTETMTDSDGTRWGEKKAHPEWSQGEGPSDWEVQPGERETDASDIGLPSQSSDKRTAARESSHAARTREPAWVVAAAQPHREYVDARSDQRPLSLQGVGRRFLS